MEAPAVTMAADVSHYMNMGNWPQTMYQVTAAFTVVSAAKSSTALAGILRCQTIAELREGKIHSKNQE